MSTLKTVLLATAFAGVAAAAAAQMGPPGGPADWDPMAGPGPVPHPGMRGPMPPPHFAGMQGPGAMPHPGMGGPGGWGPMPGSMPFPPPGAMPPPGVEPGFMPPPGPMGGPGGWSGPGPMPPGVMGGPGGWSPMPGFMTAGSTRGMCEARTDRRAASLDRLKAMLQPTAEQETAWRTFEQAAVAATDRERRSCAALPSEPPQRQADAPLPQRLETVEKQLTAHLDNLRAMREAFRGLYDALSPEQRAMLDRLPVPAG